MYSHTMGTRSGSHLIAYLIGARNCVHVGYDAICSGSNGVDPFSTLKSCFFRVSRYCSHCRSTKNSPTGKPFEDANPEPSARELRSLRDKETYAHDLTIKTSGTAAAKRTADGVTNFGGKGAINECHPANRNARDSAWPKKGQSRWKTQVTQRLIATRSWQRSYLIRTFSTIETCGSNPRGSLKASNGA